MYHDKVVRSRYLTNQLTKSTYCESITDHLPASFPDENCTCNIAYGAFPSLSMDVSCDTVEIGVDIGDDDELELFDSPCQHHFTGQTDNFMSSIYAKRGKEGITLGIQSSCDFGPQGGSIELELESTATVLTGLERYTECTAEYQQPLEIDDDSETTENADATEFVTVTCVCSTSNCIPGYLSLACGDFVVPCFNILDMAVAFDGVL